MSTQSIPLEDIAAGSTTQVRAYVTRDELVTRYKEDFELLDPVDLFDPGGEELFLVGDGYHRIQAARELGHETIQATVQPGGVFEAVLWGLRRNGAHGQRLTTAEKRAALLRLLTMPEAVDLSSRELAAAAGVTHSTVQRYRKSLDGRTGESEEDYPEIERGPKEPVDFGEALVDVTETPEAQPEPEGAGAGDEWYTPEPFIEAARQVMGKDLHLDPASSEKANLVVGAGRIFTEADSGLEHEWIADTVWCNPPYSMAEAFVRKALEEYGRRRAHQVMLLINAKVEAKYFAPLWEHALCFVRSRIKFLDGTTMQPAQTGRSASVLVYLGDRHELFARTMQLDDDAGRGCGQVVLPHRGGAYALRPQHKRLCAVCSEPCTTGEYCPKCKQYERHDRRWRRPALELAEVSKGNGREPDVQAITAELRSKGATWWQVAELLVDQGLLEDAKTWRERIRNAKAGEDGDV